MLKKLNEVMKNEAAECMAKNMSTLRAMLHLSQADLAALIGIGRQTLVAIETRKRKMTWNTFLSLLFIFSQNRETEMLLGLLGIYPQELKEIYTSFSVDND